MPAHVAGMICSGLVAAYARSAVAGSKMSRSEATDLMHTRVLPFIGGRKWQSPFRLGAS